MFHNTIHATGQQLIDFTKSEMTSKERVLQVFENGQSYTPFEVWQHLDSKGYKYPITSIRRAITDLTTENKLIKQNEQRAGNYGKPNYTWKIQGSI